MSKDLVERLRALAPKTHSLVTITDAAERLETLERNMEEMRAAMQALVSRLVVAHNANLGAQDHAAIHEAERLIREQA